MIMHLSPAVRRSLAVGLALAAMAAPSHAATNLNSSKSNVYRTIANAADEADCIKAGGIVVILDGKRTCSTPAPTSPAPASN